LDLHLSLDPVTDPIDPISSEQVSVLKVGSRLVDDIGSASTSSIKAS